MLLSCAATVQAAPVASEVPVPVVQECLSGAAAISPDNRFAVIGGQLWTMRGEKVRDLVPDADAFTFAASGKLLLASSHDDEDDARVAVYDFPSGRLKRVLKGFRLADGAHLLRPSGNFLRVFDLNLRALGRFPAQTKNSEFSTFDFSPDGRLVVVAHGAGRDNDGTLRIYEVKSGRLRRTLRDPRGGFGQADGLHGPVAWSPDGNILVAGGEDPDWQIPGDDGGPKTEAFYAHSYALKILDWQRGKIVRVVKGFGSNEGGVSVSGFLDAHRVLADKKVVDVPTGKVVSDLSQVLSATEHLAVSPDKRTILTNYNGGPGVYTSLVDVASGKVRLSFPRPSMAGKRSLAWSPDGHFLAAGDEDGALVFDAHTARLVGHAAMGAERLFWRDNTHLRGERIGIVDEWRVGESVETAFEWRQPGTFTYSFSTSPQGTRAVTQATISTNGKRDEGLQVFDLTSKTVVAQFAASTPDPGNPRFRQAPDANAIKWLDEDRFVAVLDRVVETFDVASQTVSARFPLPDDIASGFVCASLPLKKWFLVAATSKPKNGAAHSVVLLYRDGETIPFWRQEQLDTPTSWSNPLAWSSDRRFLAASRNGSVLVFDLEHSAQNAREVKVGRTSSGFGGIALSPDGRLLAARVGTSTQVWSVSTGELRLSWKVFPATLAISQLDQKGWEAAYAPAAWLALTPQGFYDGSANAEQWLRWRSGNALLPVGSLIKERRSTEKIIAALRP